MRSANRRIMAAALSAVMMTASAAELTSVVSFAAETDGSAVIATQTTEAAEETDNRSVFRYYQGVMPRIYTIEANESGGPSLKAQHYHIPSVPGVTYGKTTFGELKELYSAIQIDDFVLKNSNVEGMTADDVIVSIFVQGGPEWGTWQQNWDSTLLELDGLEFDDSYVVETIGLQYCFTESIIQQLEPGDQLIINQISPASNPVTQPGSVAMEMTDDILYCNGNSIIVADGTAAGTVSIYADLDSDGIVDADESTPVYADIASPAKIFGGGLDITIGTAENPVNPVITVTTDELSGTYIFAGGHAVEGISMLYGSPTLNFSAGTNLRGYTCGMDETYSYDIETAANIVGNVVANVTDDVTVNIYTYSYSQDAYVHGDVDLNISGGKATVVGAEDKSNTNLFGDLTFNISGGRAYLDMVYKNSAAGRISCYMSDDAVVWSNFPDQVYTDEKVFVIGTLASNYDSGWSISFSSQENDIAGYAYQRCPKGTILLEAADASYLTYRSVRPISYTDFAIVNHAAVIDQTFYYNYSNSSNNTIYINDSSVGYEIIPVDVTKSVEGGVKPYRYYAQGLPEGLTLDSETGIISGTPTQTSEDYVVTITAYDSKPIPETVTYNVYGGEITTDARITELKGLSLAKNNDGTYTVSGLPNDGNRYVYFSTYDPSSSYSSYLGSKTYQRSSSSDVDIVDGIIDFEDNEAVLVGCYDANGYFTKLAYLPKPYDVPVTGITLDITDTTVTDGDWINITPAITPADATEQTVEWSVSNTDILMASFDNDGSFRAVGLGEVTVTATTVDGGYSASANITIQPQYDYGIVVQSIEPDSRTVVVAAKGDGQVFEAKILPENYTGGLVSAISVDPNIVTVENCFDGNGVIRTTLLPVSVGRTRVYYKWYTSGQFDFNTVWSYVDVIVTDVGLKATGGDSSVSLEWNAIEGATKYNVERTNPYGYGYDITRTFETTDTFLTDIYVENGTEYTYTVSACIDGVWTGESEEVKVTPAPVKPVFTTVTAGDGQVTLIWSAPEGATKYALYSYLGGKYTLIGTTSKNAYIVSDLTNGTTYGFLVRAYVNGAWSAYTKADNVYATPTAPSVGKPEFESVTAGDGNVALVWTVPEGASRFAVYTYTKTDGYKLIGTTSKRAYVVSGLTNGTAYGFLVRAYGNGVWSEYTKADLVYATPVSAETVGKPEITTITPGDGKMTLIWSKPDGAIKYAVYSYTRAEGYKLIGTTSRNAYIVSGLTNGTAYGFLVRACGSNGVWSEYTKADNVYATPTA